MNACQPFPLLQTLTRDSFPLYTSILMKWLVDSRGVVQVEIELQAKQYLHAYYLMPVPHGWV